MLEENGARISLHAVGYMASHVHATSLYTGCIGYGKPLATGVSCAFPDKFVQRQALNESKDRALKGGESAGSDGSQGEAKNSERWRLAGANVRKAMQAGCRRERRTPLRGRLLLAMLACSR